MSDTPEALKNGLTYADAGVDIDAGEQLVDAIKPWPNPRAAPAQRPRWAVSAPCST